MEKNSLFTVKAKGNKERNAWNLTDILGLTNEVKRYYTDLYSEFFYILPNDDSFFCAGTVLSTKKEYVRPYSLTEIAINNILLRREN